MQRNLPRTGQKGIAYQSVDISQDAEALERLKALGYMQAPVVVTDQDHWSGFRPDKIEELALLSKPFPPWPRSHPLFFLPATIHQLR